MRPAPPLRPSLASWLLIPVRLPPGQLPEVSHLPPLGVANVTSTVGERDVTPSARGSPALQRGPVAPIHLPMKMSTTPATPSWSCLPTPSSRPPCSWTFSELDELMVALSCSCSARPASPRTRPSGSRSRTRPLALSRGPGRAISRHRGWTCILVAFCCQRVS